MLSQTNAQFHQVSFPLQSNWIRLLKYFSTNILVEDNNPSSFFATSIVYVISQVFLYFHLDILLPKVHRQIWEPHPLMDRGDCHNYHIEIQIPWEGRGFAFCITIIHLLKSSTSYLYQETQKIVKKNFSQNLTERSPP